MLSSRRRKADRFAGSIRRFADQENQSSEENNCSVSSAIAVMRRQESVV